MTGIWSVNTGGVLLAVARSKFDIDGHEPLVELRSEQGKALGVFTHCRATPHCEGLDVIVEHGGHLVLEARTPRNVVLAALAQPTLERMTIHGGLRL